MNSKLSVEDMLGNLERNAVFHREQEAFHAQQEAHHRDQRAVHAAELEKVLASLEALRLAVSAAAGLAQPLAPDPPAPAEEEELPPPGRLMVSRLLRLIVDSQAPADPFSPSAVAAEANRRFASRLKSPVSSRTASDVLRRMLTEGEIRLVSKGTAFHEARYAKR
jgi:hypothetical protein